LITNENRYPDMVVEGFDFVKTLKQISVRQKK